MLAAGDASLGVRVQVPRAAAVYLGIVQFFFALTWMVYVTFLPQLLDPYGIERSTLITVTMFGFRRGVPSSKRYRPPASVTPGSATGALKLTRLV